MVDGIPDSVIHRLWQERASPALRAYRVELDERLHRRMMAATVEITTRRTALQTEAPAKINLTLDVLGKRGDGFHEIRSLVIGVGLSDVLTCTPNPQSGQSGQPTQSRLTLSCSDPGLENDDNLAMIAGRALAAKCDPDTGVALHIEKRIPPAAGLGGGSSDAAAALRLCDRVWSARLSGDQLSAIGADIGSDVPLFFSLPVAVVTGRGEVVRTVSMRWTGWVVLVHTGLHVSTAEVYRAWSADDHDDTKHNSTPNSKLGVIDEILSAESADTINRLCTNELTAAVCRTQPKVCHAHDALTALGLGTWNLTGAGSSFYRLYDSAAAAKRASAAMQNTGMTIRSTTVRGPIGISPIVSTQCKES